MKQAQERRGYVIVAPGSGSDDLSDAIQTLIDENPNRTLFFPDGEYRISKPILTPADPRKRVDLRLSNFAVLKATEDWSDGEAMVRLGGKDPANTITVNGSNYGLTGGVIDGNGRASGISVDSGRETRICDVNLKHTKIGIRIKVGANNRSSDSDILNVNIVGNGEKDSIGVLIEGFDNTLTNLRIANVATGVKLYAAGNFLRNVHPLYTLDWTDYENSCGFFDAVGSNWYNMCYSDEFCVGFRNSCRARSVYNSCFAFWYSSNGGKKTAFYSDDAFDSIVTDFNVGFLDATTENAVLRYEKPGGRGVLQNLIVQEELVNNTQYKAYLTGNVISRE